MGAVEDQAVIEAIGDAGALDRALLSGGSPDARGPDGRSALEGAIECDHVQSLRRLIRAGAHVNAARPDGWTALHMAVDIECDGHVQRGLPLDLRHIQPLLDAGADPSAAWTGGRPADRTPIDMAHDCGHTAAVEAMRRALGQADEAGLPIGRTLVRQSVPMRTLDVGVETDGLFWAEVKAKGVLGGVIIRDADSGAEYLVEFFTPYTLREAVEDELSRHPLAVLPPNSIVVEEITPEHLQRAVDSIDLRGFTARETGA